jgi:hypothetical protein
MKNATINGDVDTQQSLKEPNEILGDDDNSLQQQNAESTSLFVSLEDGLKAECVKYDVTYVCPNDNPDRRKLMFDQIQIEKAKEKGRKRKRTEVEKEKGRKRKSTEVEREKGRKRKSTEVEREKGRKRKRTDVAREKDRLRKVKKRADEKHQQRRMLNDQLSLLNKPDQDEQPQRPTVSIDESVKKALETILRTHRGDNKHRASVCLVCDRLSTDHWY